MGSKPQFDKAKLLIILQPVDWSINPPILLKAKMNHIPINLSEEEKEIARFLVEKFDKEGRHVGVTELPMYREADERRLKKVLDRFSRYQLVEWASNMGVDVLPSLLDLVAKFDSPTQTSLQGTSEHFPLEITESLAKFRSDHPDHERNTFLMMRFSDTGAHREIVASIRETLKKYGIVAHRADDKEYHEDLFPNVQTYMHGCNFGIAVFERLETDDFNPNVSLEVGYMRALRRRVCLLKDRTLKTLQTDLVGKLYKEFDPQNPQGSIPPSLEQWLRDKDIIT